MYPINDALIAHVIGQDQIPEYSLKVRDTAQDQIRVVIGYAEHAKLMVVLTIIYVLIAVKSIQCILTSADHADIT